MFEVRVAQDVDASDSVRQKEHIIAVIPCHFINLSEKFTNINTDLLEMENKSLTISLGEISGRLVHTNYEMTKFIKYREFTNPLASIHLT